MSDFQRQHIVCFGNELHGDDGVGIHIYRRLRQSVWPQSVGLFNAGILGLNALSMLDSCEFAILVDALASRGRPGRVHAYVPTIVDAAEEDISHEAGIPYLLKAMNVLFKMPPEILIVGIEVQSIKAFCPELSEPVRQSIEPAVALIRGKLNRNG